MNTEEFDPSAVKAEPLEFGDSSPVETRFLSVFKWEPRKNWVQLLLAFAHSFLLEPRAGLYIKTSRYMGADPKGDANRFLSSLLKQIKAGRPQPQSSLGRGRE